jgi:hypothetical protein
LLSDQVNALKTTGGTMEKRDDDDDDRRIRVRLELPFDLRAVGWAIWHLLLGFCLGMAVHNLLAVTAGPH